MKINILGKWGPHQQDRLIMTDGVCPCVVVGSHGNAALTSFITKDVLLIDVEDI